MRLDGQNTVVSDGKNVPPLNAAIVLNNSAAFLWNLCSREDVSKEQMFNALIDNFDISTVLALCDIDVFVKTLNAYGIFENL